MYFYINESFQNLIMFHFLLQELMNIHGGIHGGFGGTNQVDSTPKLVSVFCLDKIKK